MPAQEAEHGRYLFMEACPLLQGSSVTVVAPGPQTSEQMTIAGRPCQFPFFYKGQVRNACVPYSSADSSAFCMDVDGHFAMCSPNPVSAYSTFQSWLDQWAGKGALQTAVSPHVDWAEVMALHCSPAGIAMEAPIVQAPMRNRSQDCFAG